MGTYLDKLHNGTDPAMVVLETESIINSYHKDINDLVMYSFRYSLGRSSYAVSDVCTLISKHKDIIFDYTMRAIKKEIQEYLESSPQGHTREWLELLRDISNDPKGYSISAFKVPETKVKCTYRDNGFVCIDGYDKDDDRLRCNKCSGTGYVIKGKHSK